MLERFKFRVSQMPQAAIIAALFTVGLSLALSQPSAYGQFFSVQQFPAGAKPLGIASLRTGFPSGALYVATANSGDNTVSLFKSAGSSLTPINYPGVPAVYGVPAPYSVVSCVGNPLFGFLVTSSSGNSVTWLKLSLFSSSLEILSTELRTINVGPQPYSAVCYSEGAGTSTSPYVVKAVVSTLGDNTLSLVDLNSGQVTMRIPNVPGSRALHGVVVDGNNNAWVAGTDTNVVTVVNLGLGKIIASFPVRQPIAVVDGVYVASGIDNNVTLYASSGQIISTFGIAANPQDFIFRTPQNFYTYFAATSSGNSVVQTLFDNSGQVAGSAVMAANIPGAFGLEAANINDSRTGGFATILFATSRDSNSVYLIQSVPQAPIPQAFAVSNAASFSSTTGIAAGSLASAFATTGATQSFLASSLPLPKALGGVTMTVGGTLIFDATNNKWVYSPTGAIQAPLLFVGPGQINFQIPPGIVPGTAVPAQLTKPDGTTLLTALNITAAAPGIFTLLQNGQGQAALLNQDNSQNFGTNPATRGSVIQIFATGGGDTTPTLMPGEAAPASGNPLVLTNVQPTVTIGGQSAQVLFSGMAPGFVGLWQINAQIPQNVTPGNAVPLVVNAGGVASNTVTIAVQ